MNMLKKLTHILIGSILFFLVSNHAVFGLQLAGKSSSPIYSLFQQIDLLTINKKRYLDRKVYFSATYPKLEGFDDSTNHPNIKNFNQSILNIIDDEKTAFQKKVEEANLVSEKNDPKFRKASLYIDYSSSIIKIKGHPILSIRFNIQGMIGRMAHPYHKHHTINYDLETGEDLTLATLFQQHDDYLYTLAKISNTMLSKRLKNQALIDEGTAPLASNYNNWNMLQNGILITFEEYQVAAYAQGPQSVFIPWKSLNQILTRSPFNYCLTQKHCASTILLTGGFTEHPIYKGYRTLDPTFSLS